MEKTEFKFEIKTAAGTYETHFYGRTIDDAMCFAKSLTCGFEYEGYPILEVRHIED